MLGLVLLNYNDYNTCELFVQMIIKYGIIDHIVVVDNCSSDDSYEKIKLLSNEKVDVIRTEYNGGYAYGNNYGARYLIEKYACDYLIISNPDVVITEESISICYSFLKINNQYSACAPYMVNKAGNFVPCAWDLPSWFRYATNSLFFFPKKGLHTRSEYNSSPVLCDCLAGSFFMIKACSFVDAGMFDENTFLYGEETILGFRLGRHRCASLATCNFLHNHSVSINKTFKKSSSRQRLIWKSRQYVLKHYYHINFLQKIIVKVILTINNIESFIITIIKK